MGSYPNIAARVLNRLRDAAGGIVSMVELIVHAWRGALVPLTACNIVHRAVAYLRRHGFPIVTHGKRGYSFKPVDRCGIAAIIATYRPIDAIDPELAAVSG